MVKDDGKTGYDRETMEAYDTEAHPAAPLNRRQNCKCRPTVACRLRTLCAEPCHQGHASDVSAAALKTSMTPAPVS